MRSRVSRLFSLVITSALLCSGVIAQDGERGRGGPPGGGGQGGGPGGFRGGGPGGGGGPRGGFGGGGILDELRRDSVKSEVGLTDDQSEKLRKISEETDFFGKMGPAFQKMRSAETEEQRAAAREEMRVAGEALNAEVEAKAKLVLDEKQFTRARQINLQRQGTRALTRTDVAKELGYSPQQIEQMRALQTEYDNARFQQGFQASEEDRQKLRDDFEAKMNGVLTADQKSKWTTSLGAAAPEDTNDRWDRGGGRDRGRGGSRNANSTPGVPFIEAVPEGAVPTIDFGAGAMLAAVPGGTAPPKGTTEQPAAAPASGGLASDVRMSFNFRYAPWAEVLKLFAERAGLTLDLTETPPGTFNYYDKKSYTPTEALDILNGYLLQKGYILVRRDEFLVCLRLDGNPIPPNLIPEIRPSELDLRGRNELLTVAFPVTGVDVSQVAKELDSLRGPQGSVVGLKSTNTIMATDTGANLRRIRDIVDSLASQHSPQDRVFRAYAVKNIDAYDAETIVKSLLGIAKPVSNVSSSAGGDSRFGGFGGGFGGGGFGDRGRGDRDPREMQAMMQRAQSAASPTGHTQVTADERTNKLLVTATIAEHDIVKSALETVDVEGEGGGRGSRKPYLVVYKIDNADPREVTKSIDSIMPGIVINEDGRNGKIHIMATQEQHREVEALIRQMDGVGLGAQQVIVIPLVKKDPVAVAATIRSMFATDGQNAPTVEADLAGRQVMVRGTLDQVTQVKNLLTQLGEDGTGQKPSERGMVRTFSLYGRDPEEVMPLIEKIWANESPTPIRIVTPDQRGLIRGMRAPTGETPASSPARPAALPLEEPRSAVDPQGAPAASPPSTPTSAPNDRDGTQARVRWGDDSALQFVDVSSDAEPAPARLAQAGAAQPAETPPNAGSATPQRPAPMPQGGEGAPAAPPASSPRNPAVQNNPKAPPVIVTVVGGELILSSTDEASLDRLEEMLESTLASIPIRNSWTVFTLRSADATEAATMLEQLIPDSRVMSSSSSSGTFGSLTSGLSGFGSTMMDATGITSTLATNSLRIIPEPRLNALFVSGPPHRVREVEEMLDILDLSELPDTDRDRQPRMIPVEYADVADVFTSVRELYRDYTEEGMQAQMMGGRGGPNIMAMMMGGGGRGNEQGRPPQIKLALSMDDQTNTLIVSANDSLYNEIRELVGQLDKAALESRKSVRIVSLENTNAAVISSTLGTLMPKVRVSSSRGRSRPTTNDGQSGGQPTTPPAPNPDDLRRMFEQRMQNRGGGGGGGGGAPSGFTPGGGGGGGRTFGGGDSGRGNRGGDCGRSGGNFGGFGGFGGGNFGGGGNRGGR